MTSLRIGRGRREKPARYLRDSRAGRNQLRNIDWIESNRRKVDQLSGGKLAYVYLPDTGDAGFTNFNRYYFAQTDKQGVVIDERFNSGGQVADYFIEVMIAPRSSRIGRRATGHRALAECRASTGRR